jgi:predicted small secreted protein
MSANMRVGSKLPFPLLVLGAGCVTGCSLTADGGGPVVGSFGQALEGAVLAPGTALYAPKPHRGAGSSSLISCLPISERTPD